MLILHIGTHKTGTSALQRFCTRNTEALDQVGLHYLEAGRDGALNHHKLAWKQKGSLDLALWEKARGELAAYADKACLISSEAFWFSDPTKVRAQLPGGQPVTIVAYVRRQDRYLQSLYKQAVLGGRKTRFDQWLSRFAFRGDYLSVLDRWAAEFGPEAIVLRPYEREGERKDIAEDFLGFLGFGQIAETQQKKIRGNPSPRRELLELIRAFNRLELEVKSDRLFFPVIKGVPEYTRSADLLNHAEAIELLSRFDDSNRLLEDRYNRGDTPLFPPLRPALDPEIWAPNSPEHLTLTSRFLENLMTLTLAGEIKRPDKDAGPPAA